MRRSWSNRGRLNVPNKVSLYANVGPELTQYDVDVDAATLTRRGTVSLPANVQYVWPHASRRHLVRRDQRQRVGHGTVGKHASRDRVRASIRVSGALSPHGAPIRLPTRPIHMATDMPSRIRPGRVQQSERNSCLPDQRRRNAGRRGGAAGLDRSRHLRPPGARDTGQSPGDPGHARPRRRGWQAGANPARWRCSTSATAC